MSLTYYNNYITLHSFCFCLDVQCECSLDENLLLFCRLDGFFSTCFTLVFCGHFCLLHFWVSIASLKLTLTLALILSVFYYANSMTASFRFDLFLVNVCLCEIIETEKKNWTRNIHMKCVSMRRLEIIFDKLKVWWVYGLVSVGFDNMACVLDFLAFLRV